MEAQILAVVLPVVVPYVTAAIKWAWAQMFSALPKWTGPLKAVIAGWIVSGISTAIGYPLPVDLGSITEDQTTQILMSGTIIGGIGALIRNLFDSLRKKYGPENWIGKLVRAIAGHGEPAAKVLPDSKRSDDVARDPVAPK